MFATAAAAALMLAPLPVRALHFLPPDPGQIADLNKFIRETCPKEGVNTLVLEIDYHYKFSSRPEMSDPGGLDFDQLRSVAEACRDANVRLIPSINLLGHQSWAKTNGALLTKHPEFDETPGKYPNNEGIYCRSYCPNHPDLHNVLFALIDELLEVTQADAFHAGMDEVFILGDKDCKRCGGKDPADLFAQEVGRIHQHLKAKGVEMWMWADRFLDGKTTGIGEWEAATNGTHLALDRVSKDIVLCDWHYEQAHPTAAYFALKGFRVVSCPWRKPEVALAQLAQILDLRKHAAKAVGERVLGVMQTTWGSPAEFLKAYAGDSAAGASSKEVVQTFKALFGTLAKP